MQNTIFVRPNLRLFVLGALLIALVHSLILAGSSNGPALPVSARQPMSDGALQTELDELLEQARTKPSAALCQRISACYEQQRNYRQAVRYLRRAEKLGFGDEDE